MKIMYSAPAQVILSGEEGMLYGRPAIASAVKQRVKVSLHKNKPGVQSDKIDLVVRKHLGIKAKKKYDFEVDSDFDNDKLGYFHAVAVAKIACLYEFYSEKKAKKERINSLAFQSCKEKDRVSAGLRVSAAVFGGLVFYRKEFEFLKSVYTLPFKIPKNIETNLCVGASHKKIHHEVISKMYKKDPKKTEDVLSQLEKITKRMIVAIVKEDADFFFSQIDAQRSILKEIGIDYSNLLYRKINDKINTLEFMQSSKGLQRE